MACLQADDSIEAARGSTVRSPVGFCARLSCKTLLRRPFTADSPSWDVCLPAGSGVLSPGSAAAQLGVVSHLSIVFMPTQPLS